MAHYISPPDALALLPPLVACLPTAFVSPRPPPALIELLSPILRQRLQLLSDASEKSSWLPLLCWDPDSAAQLVARVESGTFEPHPVSGEIELGNIGSPEYRLLDDETLQSRLILKDLGLQAIYLRCNSEASGATSNPSWLLAELCPMEATSQDKIIPWHSSISEASDKLTVTNERNTENPQSSLSKRFNQDQVHTNDAGGGDNDEEYWAQYDITPGRTSVLERQPQQGQRLGRQTNAELTLEEQYFSMYASVQPDMDNDDPSLHGNSAQWLQETLPRNNYNEDTRPANQIDKDTGPGPLNGTTPFPSFQVAKGLEELAEKHSTSEIASIAVQHHISTSIKSLFRLARGAGLARGEFERVVRTELSILAMLEDGDED